MYSDDQMMLVDLKARNTQAQEYFWAKYYRDVNRICKHILGEGPDTTEIAVDIVVDFMFKYVDNLTHAKALRSYLRLMAIRRCQRRLKELSRFKNANLDDISYDNSANPEHWQETHQLSTQLSKCLEGLTPKAQQVIRLRYGRQFTNERIGTLVGGSRQYIGRLLRRSLVLLRVCLEKATANEAS